MVRTLLIRSLYNISPLSLSTPYVAFVLWGAGPHRVSNEAAALGISWEAPGENGMQDVRSRHRGRAIVDHQVLVVAAEESPGRLQSGDEPLQLLQVHGPTSPMVNNDIRLVVMTGTAFGASVADLLCELGRETVKRTVPTAAR